MPLQIHPAIYGFESLFTGISFLIVAGLLIWLMYRNNKKLERFYDDNPFYICLLFIINILLGLFCKFALTIFYFVDSDSAKVRFSKYLIDELLYNFMLTVMLVLFMYTLFNIFCNYGIKLAGHLTEEEDKQKKYRIVNVLLSILIPTIILDGTVWGFTMLSIQYVKMYGNEVDRVVEEVKMSTNMIFFFLCIVFGTTVILKTIFIYQQKKNRVEDKELQKSYKYLFRMSVAITTAITIRSFVMLFQPIIPHIFDQEDINYEVLTLLSNVAEDLLMNLVAWCTIVFLMNKKGKYMRYQDLDEIIQ
ncbi:7 TM domain-containing transmembrane protein [Acrasis kona]|uniref:7 TM domain-containing transmembrane protein n=1 Tax=Acrasis kona TaxID=1008807 RepID=A0AAW2ZBX6_9EUKA